MSEWWYVLIVLALVAIGAAVAWSRRTRTASRIDAGDAPGPLSRNYTQERETTRTGGLSTEDQAWEADRLRRDQDAHAASKQPPEPEEHVVPPEPSPAQERRNDSDPDTDDRS